MADGIPSVLKDQMREVEDARKEIDAAATADQAVDQVPSEPEPQIQPQTVPQPPTAPEAEGKTDPAPQPADQDWEHKFDVINGKYVKETGRQIRQIKDLTAENEALKRQLQERQAVPATPAPQPANTPPPTAPVTMADVSEDDVKALIDAQQIEDYGMDFWRQQIALQKNMQGGVPKSPASDERVERVERRLNDQARDVFYSELKTFIPNWEQLQASKQWKEDFLTQIEPAIGLTYEDLLLDAYQAYDSLRAAEIFRRFTSNRQNTPGTPPSQSQEVPKPAPANGVPSPGQKATMTFAQWKKAMDDLASSGLQPMAYNQRHRELIAAYSEGRVTGVPEGVDIPDLAFI